MKYNSLLCLFLATVASVSAQDLNPTLLGTYRHTASGESPAEIVAHDPGSQRLFVVNAGDNTVDVLDVRNPRDLKLITRIRIPAEAGAAPNSVAVHNGLVAVAVEADPKQEPGSILFMDVDGRILKILQAGALPDMVTFTPDGKKVLTANEGEPNDDYTVDPEGSITIVDLTAGIANVTQADVRTAHFRNFTLQNLEGWVRIFGPGASIAQDLEPEYIAVSPDSKTAYVTLQENNAVAVVNIDTATVTRVAGLGVKEHWREENSLDASDRDNANRLRTFPVWGMYQPDTITGFVGPDGNFYLATANEGDARAYGGFSEETRVASLRLDPASYPNASEIQQNADMGRLRVTNAHGDLDGDGDYDMLFSFGARSFSIWTSSLQLAFDSMNHFEIINSVNLGEYFNVSNSDNSRDSRSDDKGPEPEAIVTGMVRGKQYIFIANERQSNIIVYEVNDAYNPRYITQFGNRDYTKPVDSPEAGDLGPEGMTFLAAANSPTGKPLLVVSNEISGTTSVWEID
jgi:hypothetical protein